MHLSPLFFFFFFNDTATTEIYTLSLHDALPICDRSPGPPAPNQPEVYYGPGAHRRSDDERGHAGAVADREDGGLRCAATGGDVGDPARDARSGVPRIRRSRSGVRAEGSANGQRH